MNLTRTSPLSGNTVTLDIPMDQEEFAYRYKLWRDGMKIQDAFDTLSPDFREFIKSGISPQEWDDLFGDEEDCEP